MSIRLTIKNYRCFVAPAVVQFSPGFTAFVGINNAGKSALIRFLVEFRQLFSFLQDRTVLSNHLAGIRSNPISIAHVFDPQEAFSNLNDNSIEVELKFAHEEPLDTDSPTKILISINRDLSWEIKTFHQDHEFSFEQRANWLPGKKIVSKNGRATNLSVLLEAAEIFCNTLYIGPFRNIINVGANTSYFDIQIGDAFVSQFRELKTGPNKKNSIGIQRLIDDVKKIFEFESLSIDPSSDNHSLHITVNGKPFKQHELGSGLSQFIVVLSNAAIKRPSLILIDEPELNLHPRLQLDFLTALGTYSKNGVWFSTHSLGLARSAAEAIYSVQRLSDGNSVVAPLAGTLRPAELLGELSFSSQKEMGLNQILLVEGPTEVKVIQQLLRKKHKDHLIVLLPMYGHMPDAVELDEVLRITTNVSALIDSEKTSATALLEPKRQAFVDLFKNRGLKVHVLERRATENYFTDGAIQQAFGTNYRALAPYEKLSDASPHWGKGQNWQLAADSASAIDATDLGQFLSAL
jgi:ABC-type cobalamin/Fe3+-siderophores transport system ATPase subunit